MLNYSSSEISFNLLSRTLLITSQLSYFYEDSGYTKQFEDLAEVIGTVLNVEYCLIGFKEKELLKDAADWLPGDKTEEYFRIAEKYSERPFDESLIGRSLKGREKEGFFLWSYNEDGIFQNDDVKRLFQIEGDVLDDYRTHILKSHQYSNFLTLGIYSQSRSLVGYIHVVNKKNGNQVIETLEFTSAEIETLKLISESIGILLDNLLFHKAELKDEKTVNGWYGINDVDGLLRNILKYLNAEFDSILCAYLMGAENGFQEEPMMTILRDYYIRPEYFEKYKEYIEKNKDAPAEKSLSGKIILDKLRLNGTEEQSSICFLSRKEHDVEIMWDEIPTDYVIGIPIMRSSSDSEDSGKPAKPQSQIWGVICLFPQREIIEKGRTQNRLKLFAQHVQTLIEQVIYKKRYQGLARLNSELQQLQIGISDGMFYKHIVEIVRSVSDSESCSMFYPNTEEEGLYLVATTAEKATNKKTRKQLNIEELQRSEEVIYDLVNSDSITAKVFEKKQPVLVYDVEKCIHTNPVFMESTESTHKSLIAFPLTDSNGKVFAVIRCINKSKRNRLLHVFVKGDLDLLQLIGKALSGFLKNREFFERRMETMTHFAHENRGPMQAIYDWMSILRFSLKKINIPFTKDMGHSINGLESNFAVVAQNIKNTEYFFLDILDSMEFSMAPCDIREIIGQLSKLFDGANKIISKINGPIILNVNRDAIYQVFYNLILNAIRYSHKGGKIFIRYKTLNKYEYEGWHQFSVQDYGIGIEEGEEQNIFRRYYRSENARKKYAPGTGIGLNVCQKIIEKHKGEIKVTNNSFPTEFSFSFPHSLTIKSA